MSYTPGDEYDNNRVSTCCGATMLDDISRCSDCKEWNEGEELEPEAKESCAYCERSKATGDKMMPPHTASSGCESGKRNHCTCDRCY